MGSHKGPPHQARVLRFHPGDGEPLNCFELVVISIKQEVA